MMTNFFKLFLRVFIGVAVLIVRTSGSGRIEVKFLSMYAKNVKGKIVGYELQMIFSDMTDATKKLNISHFHSIPPYANLAIDILHATEYTEEHTHGTPASNFTIELENGIWHEAGKKKTVEKTFTGWTRQNQKFNASFPEVAHYREEFSVGVKCDPHYYNPMACNVYCKPDDRKIKACGDAGDPICYPAWKGKFCSHDVNECTELSDACKNGGTCINTVGNFVCLCPSNYGGRTCAKDVDKCPKQSNMCKNGGTCIGTAEIFTCLCPPNYRGSTCTVDVNECVEQDGLCQNNGTCQNTVGSFNCDCPPLYEGPTCSSGPNVCLAKAKPPCQNGGVCINQNATFYCNCTKGFKGKLCNQRRVISTKRLPKAFHITLIFLGTLITIFYIVLVIKQSVKEDDRSLD